MRALGVGEPAALHPRQELGEVQPVDVLHDEVGITGAELEVDHAHDVGVGEQACRAGLGQDLVDGRGADAIRGAVDERHALDGDAALQAGVPAGTDGPEAAGAAPGQHPVAAEEHLVGRLGLVHAAAYERRWGRCAHGGSLCV